MNTAEEAAREYERRYPRGKAVVTLHQAFLSGVAWAEERAKAKQKGAAELVRSWLNGPGDYDERALAAIEHEDWVWNLASYENSSPKDSFMAGAHYARKHARAEMLREVIAYIDAESVGDDWKLILSKRFAADLAVEHDRGHTT